MLEQNQEMIDNSVQDQTKVVSLFQFIRELNKLKQKATKKWLSELNHF